MGGMGMTVASVKPPAARGRDNVYVAAVPLSATNGPPQLLMSTVYSLRLSWDLQHFMVLVFDFQPQEPESIYTALAVLSGKKIPGVLQMRKMKKLPKTKCWMVGSCNVDVVDAVHKFNSNWDTDLIIGQHDCRHYTNDPKKHESRDRFVAFMSLLDGTYLSLDIKECLYCCWSEINGLKGIYSLRKLSPLPFPACLKDVRSGENRSSALDF
ncbi:uncharacterized protein LOC112500256 isoform X3 [Cynara cardunculus var. scolymus]|uniref:uncharacterized protein LOC112500256 isoform X3 n=1 Tax=Cynara cardunculus var. scolymus TaxID=59895 RepID=UPI000D62B702|nr:uncharacterized protein LOC112500256 isoform X3 [Cynara cardunculus var. scolymus]